MFKALVTTTTTIASCGVYSYQLNFRCIENSGALTPLEPTTLPSFTIAFLQFRSLSDYQLSSISKAFLAPKSTFRRDELLNFLKSVPFELSVDGTFSTPPWIHRPRNKRLTPTVAIRTVEVTSSSPDNRMSALVVVSANP